MRIANYTNRVSSLHLVNSKCVQYVRVISKNNSGPSLVLFGIYNWSLIYYLDLGKVEITDKRCRTARESEKKGKEKRK